jgi:WD40 repeat protein
MHPVLPLRDHIAGAAAVPVDACSPPALPAGHAGRLPRCTLQFPESITALATTPDATALIAVEGGGVTTWQLPTAAFVRGFAPPPSIAGPADEAPHRDAPSTIAVSPDGRQAIVVIEGRLLRYATATGRLLRELPGPGGVVQSVAWSPDGGTLLVTAFYDTDVRLVSADDGAEIRRLVVEREGTAVGFTADGHGGLVGTGAGTIMLFSLDENVPPRLIEAVGRPLHALTVVGDRVASSGNDGILHLVAIATGKSLATSEPGSPCYRLALAPDAEVIACAGYDRVIRLYRVESAELIETLAWHEGPIAGLAWSGTTLLSGDVAGSLALWDLAQVIQEASRP